MRKFLFFLLALTLLGGGFPAASMAAPLKEQSALTHFKIPQLNAAEALSKLAEQADLQLLYPYRLAQSVQANPISGTFTLYEAMEKLLEGTVLQAKQTPKGYFKILPRYLIPTPLNSVVNPVLEEPAIDVMYIRSSRSKVDQTLIRQKYSAAMVEDNPFAQDGRQVDEEVVDVLLNVSGTSADHRRREGVFVTVRGFGPEFNRVLYNNRQLPNASAGDEFSLDTFSSGLFQESEVYKTPTSDLVSGGIGATINIKNALERTVKGQQGEFRYSRSYQQGVESSPQLALMYQYSVDDISSLISIDYSNQAYSIASANSDGWFEADLTGVPQKSGADRYDAVWVPRNYDLRNESGHKRSIGASWLLEYRGIDDMVLALDLLYSDLDVSANIQSAANWTHVNGVFQSAEQNENFSKITVDHNQTLLAYEYVTTADFASDYVQLTRNRPSNLKQIGFNASYDLSSVFRTSLDLSYAIAESDNGGRNRFSVVGSPNANPIYHYTPGADYAELSYGNPVGIADLKSHITINTGNDIRDRIAQIKIDNDVLLELGAFEQLYFGFYHSEREKRKEAFRSPWGGEFGGYTFDLPDSLFTPVDASGFLSGGLPQTWYSFDSDEYINYLWSDEFIQREIKEAGHWLADSIDERKALGGFDAKSLPNSSWTISERLSEAYIRLLSAGEWLGKQWSADLGARVAHTHIQSKGFEQAIAAIDYSPTDPTDLILTYAESKAIKHKNSYFHLLPNFNLKLDLTERHLIKLGVSKTLSRPSLNRLAPSMGEFVARSGASSAVAGNPKLAPYESTNFDLGWSWFFDSEGLLKASYFHKEISNFIVQSVAREQLLEHPEGNFLVVRPKNLDKTKVYGWEFSFQNKFDSLPSPFNGVGLIARYTLASSDADEGAHAMADRAIEGLSDFYNLALYYELDDLFASVSYHYRSEFVRKQSGAQGQPEMVDAYGQLDAKLSYEINSHLRLFAQAQNLTGETFRSYSIYEERLLSFEQREPRFSLGLAVKF